MPFSIDLVVCDDCWESLRDSLVATSNAIRRAHARARRAGDPPVPDLDAIPGSWSDDPDDAIDCDICGVVFDDQETEDVSPDGPPRIYRSTYEHCGETWQDDYSCACNSECPVCHEKDIEPVSYVELDANGDPIPGTESR